MNKKTTLILLIFCLLGISNLNAHKPVKNFLAVKGSLAGTFQSRFESQYNVCPFFGGSLNVGLGYQLYAYHFIFSVEAEVGASVFTNYAKEQIINGNAKIPQGTLELMGNGHVSVPTMIGGEFGKFYFKIGVVPSFNLLNGATVIGPVLNEEDPKPYESKSLMLYQNPFQLFGRFEIGGSLGQFIPYYEYKQPIARFYLGGYVDFGLTRDLPTVPRNSYGLRMPYAVSNENMSDNVHQFSVGIRFTCLLNCAK